MTSISVKPIDALGPGEGGGKARGLLQLRQFGFITPKTFVISDENDDGIEAFVSSLSTNISYAIRSSADAEDGAIHSFAGQFTSYLNVKGHEQLTDAIKKCFESYYSASAEAYRHDTGYSNGSGMNVIVQEMIVPKYSGVLFTADPVKQRQDIISLSIIEGLGEDLMAGHEVGESFNFFKHSSEFPVSKILPEDILKHLIRSAIAIENKYQKPCDLEWAIDENNVIWWLQLRPITKLTKVHFNELDDKPLDIKPIYTRGNIGEMMPGPVTPLTLSTFARAIEIGLQVFYKKVGAIKKTSEKNLFVHSYYNHLFFNMNILYNSARYISLSSKENIDYAIAGEIIPNVKIRTEANQFRAFLNTIKMIRYIGSAPKAWKQLKVIHDSFILDCSNDIKICYQQISEKLNVLFDAYTLHYVTSSQSGALYTTILNIFSKGKIPQREHQEKVAKLFTNIADIESANVLKSIDYLSKLLIQIDDIKEQFIDVPTDTSIKYLSETGPQTIKNEWATFLKRHGHRCVREAEMLEKEWALDPTPLVDGLKSKTAHLLGGHGERVNGFANHLPTYSGSDLSMVKKSIVKRLLPKARKAVARREQTKAWSIGIQGQLKSAYRHLARLMIKEGMLDDEDHIFFLTHSEIGKLINSNNPETWKKTAEARYAMFPKLESLSFPDIVKGIPFPEDREVIYDSSKGLSGIPVSQGIVNGRVRLVNTMEDARKLKKGDIMVARFTDIGWTPFYSVISGLITEIGSPLSHGAVVAREYNLPAVVSMKGAMTQLKTGDDITLDAVKGEVVKEI